MKSKEKFIQIQNVDQTFKTKKGHFPALRDINLSISKGEFITLIGHSGCGKSTLLNLVAGLTLPRFAPSPSVRLEDRVAEAAQIPAPHLPHGPAGNPASPHG